MAKSKGGPRLWPYDIYAGKLPLQKRAIAQAYAKSALEFGVSRETVCKVLGLSPQGLDDLLHETDFVFAYELGKVSKKYAQHLGMYESQLAKVRGL